MTETQGMGTVVRPAGPNGEVPRPLRSFVSLWKTALGMTRFWRKEGRCGRISGTMKTEFPIALKRPLVVFDIEATGLSPRADRILELAALRLNPDGTRDDRVWLLNPEMKIPVESIAIHGITDAEVADCPTFADKALEIYSFFEGCDLGGFAVGYFDAQILNEEFLRCGIKTFHPEARAMVDAQKIYHKREPRDLTAALKFYCGRDLGDAAHGALADAEATLEVLAGEMERYPDLPRDVDALDKLFNPVDPLNVDRMGKWRWVNGEVTVNFGKKKGTKLSDLMADRLDGHSFLKWIARSDMPEDTRAVAENALRGYLPTLGGGTKQA